MNLSCGAVRVLSYGFLAGANQLQIQLERKVVS